MSRSSPPRARSSTGEVRQLSTRTEDGEIGILANHAPLLAALRPAELRLHVSDSETKRYAQAHGWLQIFGNRARLLVEEAIAPEDLDRGALKEQLADARQRLSESERGAPIRARAEGQRQGGGLSRDRRDERGAMPTGNEVAALRASSRVERGLRHASRLHIARFAHIPAEHDARARNDLARLRTARRPRPRLEQQHACVAEAGMWQKAARCNRPFPSRRFPSQELETQEGSTATQFPRRFRIPAEGVASDERRAPGSPSA